MLSGSKNKENKSCWEDYMNVMFRTRS